MATIRLTAIDGSLYFPHGGTDADWNVVQSEPVLLMRFYSSGDGDTCPWPMVSDFATEAELQRRLARALFDERETNDFFPSDARIELPDGTPFDFDVIVA